MTEAELLAGVLRKAIASRDDPFGCYIDIDGDSIVIDGRVENLSEEEAKVLLKVYKETASDE